MSIATESDGAQYDLGAHLLPWDRDGFEPGKNGPAREWVLLFLWPKKAHLRRRVWLLFCTSASGVD